MFKIITAKKRDDHLGIYGAYSQAFTKAHGRLVAKALVRLNELLYLCGIIYNTQWIIRILQL